MRTLNYLFMSHHKNKTRKNESMEFIGILSVSDCDWVSGVREKIIGLVKKKINRKHAI
jgi:hypothetical protein